MRNGISTNQQKQNKIQINQVVDCVIMQLSYTLLFNIMLKMGT